MWLNPGTKQELRGVAKHSLKKKIIVSSNKKSARRAKARTADFSLDPVHMDRQSFIFALDNCSNRYPLVGGMRQRRFAGTNSKPRKLPENAQASTMCPGIGLPDLPSKSLFCTGHRARDRVHVEDIVPAGDPARRGCVSHLSCQGDHFTDNLL